MRVIRRKFMKRRHVTRPICVSHRDHNQCLGYRLILFIIYINDIFNKSSLGKLISIADNTVILLKSE